MRLGWAEERFVRELATAVKWRIEMDVEAGRGFDSAKRNRIRQAESTWKHLRPEVKQAVKNLCWSISPTDLSKRTHRKMADDFLSDVEGLRGRRAGLIERLFYRLTGTVFRV